MDQAKCSCAHHKWCRAHFTTLDKFLHTAELPVFYDASVAVTSQCVCVCMHACVCVCVWCHLSHSHSQAIIQGGIICLESRSRTWSQITVQKSRPPTLLSLQGKQTWILSCSTTFSSSKVRGCSGSLMCRMRCAVAKEHVSLTCCWVQAAQSTDHN